MRDVRVGVDREKCMWILRRRVRGALTIPRQKRFPSCAICRGALSRDAPMVPNIALDSLVDKHVHALGAHGADDWRPGGAKFADLMARRECVRNFPRFRGRGG